MVDCHLKFGVSHDFLPMIGAHCHMDLSPLEIKWPCNSFELKVLIQGH